MSSITFKDVHIGDTVILKNGKTGLIIRLASVPYINNFGLTDTAKNIKVSDFVYNEKRDPYKLYNTVTVFLKSYNQIINCDLDNIVKVLDDDSNYTINKKPNRLREFLISLFYKIT